MLGSVTGTILSACTSWWLAWFWDKVGYREAGVQQDRFHRVLCHKQGIYEHAPEYIQPSIFLVSGMAYYCEDCIF